jgi:ribosomal-protein-alanine N-acetyltransferase
MERVRIKKAEESNLPEVINIWKRNIETINTAADIAELFYEFKKYFFVAIDVSTLAEIGKNINVVGFVGGAIRRGRGHISGIAVEKEYRNKGIGVRLLNTAEKEFIAAGLDKVALEVRKSNRNAIQFYENQGYRWSHIVKGYYADGEDAIVYVKKI